MGTTYVCDCGKNKPMAKEDLVEMGLSKALYCKGECQERVEEFLRERDELHDACSLAWEEGMKLLTKNHGQDFILPEQWTEE